MPSPTSKSSSRLILCAILAVATAEASAQSAVRCEGPGRTPVLYENANFTGGPLRMPLERTVGLFVSDEESFDNRASAVCVPSGFRVVLYEERRQQGASLELTGPVERNLHRIGWGDRVSSVLVTRVAAPITGSAAGAAATVDGRAPASGAATASDPGGEAPETAAPGPSSPTDFERLEAAYASASAATDCTAVREHYLAMVALEGSAERTTGVPVAIGERVRRPPATVGALATLWRRELVSERQVRCFAPAAMSAERVGRAALLPDASCEAVRDAIGELWALREDRTHVPGQWARQVDGEDATVADVAGGYIDRVREQRSDCLGMESD